MGNAVIRTGLSNTHCIEQKVFLHLHLDSSDNLRNQQTCGQIYPENKEASSEYIEFFFNTIHLCVNVMTSLYLFALWIII